MLDFQPITIESFRYIVPYLKLQSYRTCDFTIGGIYMWIDYFKYEYCIADDLLFIKGYAEDENKKTAFTLPIGTSPLSHGIALLKEYCDKHQIQLLLSAVPEEGKKQIEALFPSCQAIPLPDWSDYLYNREELSTLPGRKFNKKRNRVNKFYKDYNDISHEPINENNIEEVKCFFHEFYSLNQKESLYFAYEEAMINQVLDNYFKLDMTGWILKAEGRIIGFSIGEIINDTLFVHIEKAFKQYAGAYEVINLLFAQNAATSNVIYINREEDVGDPGLRKAKLSYHPTNILTKYNIIL